MHTYMQMYIHTYMHLHAVPCNPAAHTSCHAHHTLHLATAAPTSRQRRCPVAKLQFFCVTFYFSALFHFPPHTHNHTNMHMYTYIHTFHTYIHLISFPLRSLAFTFVYLFAFILNVTETLTSLSTSTARTRRLRLLTIKSHAAFLVSICLCFNNN